MNALIFNVIKHIFKQLIELFLLINESNQRNLVNRKKVLANSTQSDREHFSQRTQINTIIISMIAISIIYVARRLIN